MGSIQTPREFKSKLAQKSLSGGIIVFILLKLISLWTSYDNKSAAALFPFNTVDNKSDVASLVSFTSITIESPSLLQNVLSSSPFMDFFSSGN